MLKLIDKGRIITFRIDRPTFRYSINYGPDFDFAVHYLGENICLDTIEQNYVLESSINSKSIWLVRKTPTQYFEQQNNNSFNEKMLSYSFTSHRNKFYFLEIIPLCSFFETQEWSFNIFG